MTTTKRTGKSAVIPVVLNVPMDRAVDLLIHGLEDGHSWMRVEKVVQPLSFVRPDWAPSYADNDYIAALVPGGSITIIDNEDEAEKSYKINLASVMRGLQVMANLKPGEGGHHFHNFMQENDDAETGYVFLQCCAFPDEVAKSGIRYG